MEKLKFNPSNKKYYSEDFIKGFECGAERQFEKDKAEQTHIVRGKWFVTKRKGKISWVTTHSGIEEDVEYGVIVTCKCSNCGYKMGELALEYNYCPKCGSRMTEESGETQ